MVGGDKECFLTTHLGGDETGVEQRKYPALHAVAERKVILPGKVAFGEGRDQKDNVVISFFLQYAVHQVCHHTGLAATCRGAESQFGLTAVEALEQLRDGSILQVLYLL